MDSPTERNRDADTVIDDSNHSMVDLHTGGGFQPFGGLILQIPYF